MIGEFFCSIGIHSWKHLYNEHREIPSTVAIKKSDGTIEYDQIPFYVGVYRCRRCEALNDFGMPKFDWRGL